MYDVWRIKSYKLFLIKRLDKMDKNNDLEKNKPYTIHGVNYRFHPEKGYSEAKAYLEEIGEWDYVSTHGFSTDGWTIIATANSIWDKLNGS
jgi:hypothetical protein